MAVAVSYPGVYVEEVPSGVRTITGVATAITGFVGYTPRGRDHRATRLFSFADYERAFGGLAADSELGYAVQQFFTNGGTDAYVVRVPKHDAVAASITLHEAVGGGSDASLIVTALSRGAWANDVIVDVTYDGVSDAMSFNLVVTDLATGAVETFGNVSMDTASRTFVGAVVNDEDSGSKLISVALPPAAQVPSPQRPAETGTSGGPLTLGALSDPSRTYTIQLTADVPGGVVSGLEFPFLEAGEAPPTSVLGACRQLERKANAALQGVLPGATIRCVPNRTGDGIRVHAFFPPSATPGALDTQLTFAAGAPDDADAGLALTDGNATANVAHYWLGRGRTALAQSAAIVGADGVQLPVTADLIGSESAFSGMQALRKVDLFNILCIPDATRALPGNPNQQDGSVDPNAVFGAAMTLCLERRAFLVVDCPPEVRDVASATDWKASGLTVHERNGAAYFPRLRLPDALNGMQLRSFAPCGVVAGLYSRTDASRGVWKAPAGIDAQLRGVQKLAYALSDPEHGALNPLGLNCFRVFPVYGLVAWGARTLVGADAEGSEWKYVPVRRIALYIEESLYRGTKWVVFEPNDEPLWAQIRLNVGAFMNTLFRQGAFQGTTPREAYFVKCDKETTTQDDINRGIVNILVGFAPLKPAEFVIIKIQQMAGQIAT
jgi:phage tail sheath protein FI